MSEDEQACRNGTCNCLFCGPDPKPRRERERGGYGLFDDSCDNSLFCMCPRCNPGRYGKHKSLEPGEKLNPGQYTEYIQSYEWRARRDAAVWQAGGRCQLCNSPNRLHGHHRTYERLGNEQPGDITVLCSDCHELFHAHRKLHGGA